jgi:tripartite-type tricarboxylate transporter receptor subunit TctC
VARYVATKRFAERLSDKLVTALQAAIKDPKVIERFSALGTEPVASALATPDALESHFSAEVKRWDTVIKAAGVKGN